MACTEELTHRLLKELRGSGAALKAARAEHRHRSEQVSCEAAPRCLSSAKAKSRNAIQDLQPTCDVYSGNYL